MLQEYLDKCFIVVALAVGVILILVNLFFMIEASKGISVFDYDDLKKGTRFPFAFSIIMFSFLWLTTSGIDKLIFNCIKCLTIAWLALTVFGLVLSFIGDDTNDRRLIRKVSFSCLTKVIITAIVFWFIS